MSCPNTVMSCPNTVMSGPNTVMSGPNTVISQWRHQVVSITNHSSYTIGQSPPARNFLWNN